MEKRPYYYFVGNEMAALKDVFAYNLKKKRREYGFTQAQLAEKVEVSTHHIAMIEIARNYPTLELVERIANVLGIEIYELFLEKPIPKDTVDRIYKDVITDIKQVVGEAVETAIREQCLIPKNERYVRGKTSKKKW